MLVRQTPNMPPSPRRVYGLQEEPPNLRGLLFKQDVNGSVEILKYSGETDPDAPPDIPADAVTDKGVYISVDGIGQDWSRHRAQIQEWFHGMSAFGASVNGPVIGIHEGEGRSGLHDGVRIVKNTGYLKALQSGLVPAEKIRGAAYRNDPSVKTIHDQLKQSLTAGRHVTLMAHSGGGSQVALALGLLAMDSSHDWKPEIGKNIRVLGTAPSAHRKDYEWAGVEHRNIMMTGSKKDPVYRFYRNYIDPKNPLTALKFVGDGLAASIKFALKPGPYHTGEYIFGKNLVNGTNRIEDFLHGGEGRDAPLP